MKPPLAPHAIRELWPAEPDKTERWSRSLWFDRFADPRLTDDRNASPRRDFMEHGMKLKPVPGRSRSWLRFLRIELAVPLQELLFAQLQSRLLVNASGCVMENAGLALDRLTGQPFIPGSAVKGCARRMALQTLHDSASGWTPPANGVESESEHAARVRECALLLAVIASAFGWSELEWTCRDDFKPQYEEGETDADYQKRWDAAWRAYRSDFAWACGDDLWEEVRVGAGKVLAQRFSSAALGDGLFWEGFPASVGSVQFLPSYPVEVKLSGPLPTPDGVGKLELDLLAAHHRRYHEGDPDFAEAPDTEDPNLVFFPAVAAGHVFVFAVKGRSRDLPLVEAARSWLMKGLELFGLGAKTAAGYGWFLDVSQAVSKMLVLEEKLAPWRGRLAGFAGLTEPDKEAECLSLLSEPDVWKSLEQEKGSRPMKRYFDDRAQVMNPPSLALLMRATTFQFLPQDQQEELALDLSINHLAFLRDVCRHFPHSLAALQEYLQANGLWPNEP